MKAYIRAVGAWVPEKRIDNEELSRTVDTTDEWIFSHTGIRTRYIAANDEAASDLAVKAAGKALSCAGISASEVDLIIVATTTPDFPGLPSTAAIVQDKLKANRAGAMDIAAACTGFVYGLETAKNFIVAGACEHVLVIGSETFSKILNWKDRNTCVLFGDGAGAVLVSANKEHRKSEIIHSFLRSDGSGARFLERTAGGSRFPISLAHTKEEDLYVRMDGRKVYTFAVRAIVDTVEAILSAQGLSISQIARIIPHQANIRIIEAAAKRLGVPLDMFFINIGQYANTSAASIPIALNELYEHKALKHGDLLLFVGFGGGLTYGGNLVRW